MRPHSLRSLAATQPVREGWRRQDGQYMGVDQAGPLGSSRAALKDGLELAKQNGARTLGRRGGRGPSSNDLNLGLGGPRVAKWEHPTSVRT